MEVTGKSLWQQARIDELIARLNAAELDLNAKLYKHVYDGKIALLESNDARHDADIAHLESNTVLKTSYNDTVERLNNKDAIHDVRINTLEALKNTKKDLAEYLTEMGEVDVIDADHEDRITALEARVLEFEDQITDVINVSLGQKINKTVVEAIKQELLDADSAFAQDLATRVSSQVQTAIDAAQDLKIDGKVENTVYDAKVTELTGNNLNWEKRLNAVDQYIRAMLETYEIKFPGQPKYVYEANYNPNLAIEKKHFKIVGRKIPGIVVAELEPFAYNTFYGKMTLHLKGTTALPVATVSKSDVNSSTRRVELKVNGNLNDDSFPLIVTMYNTDGEIIHQDISLTKEVFQNPLQTPILSAPLFKYANANLKLVASTEYWSNNYSFAPEAVAGSSMSGIGWRYTGNLPSGMAFANGVISGVPTTPGNFSIDVFAKYTANGNDENGVQLNFEVISVPTVAYSGVLASYKRNHTIVPVSATVNNINYITNFGISPALPSGMEFNTANGLISGTPTVTSPLTTYTVTAYGLASGGNGITSFEFGVSETAPVISYEFSAVAPKNNVSLPVDILMPETMPNIGELSGPINSYAIDIALPAGLSFSTTNGKISGTPTAPSVATSYTITASGPGGSGFATIVLGVKADIPVFSYNANNEYRQGVAITPLAPVAGEDSGAINATGGYVLYSAVYDSNGVFIGTPVANLDGLEFDSDTGVISGIPNMPMATTGYAVIATGPGGASSEMPFYITVKAAVPVIGYGSAENVATRGVQITPFGPTSATNSPTYYSIVPLLPIGMNFNNATGFVSGTPRVVSDPAVTYNVIAYNAGGESVAVSFTLKVVEPAPEIAYSVTDKTFTAGVAITPIVPSLAKNRIDTWSMTDAPSGLVIDSATGVISGTPSIRNNEAVNVVVSAGGNGIDSFTISMRVKEVAPVFSYPAGTRVLNLGVVANIAPTFGNDSAVDSWALAPGSAPLPAGLELTSTGVISGTPTAVGGPVNVAVIATGKDFSSVAMPVVFDVNDVVPTTGYKVDGQLDAGAGFEVKVWSNSASNEDIVFVKKTSSGSVTANLAYTSDLTADASDLSVYTSIGQATFANNDYYRFVINRATQHGARLAVIENLGDSGNDVLLARFLIDPKYEVFTAPVISIAPGTDLTYETNEVISIPIVNTGGPITNYQLVSGSGLTFNVANNTLYGSLAEEGVHGFSFKAIGKGGDSNVVSVDITVTSSLAGDPRVTLVSYVDSGSQVTYNLTGAFTGSVSARLEFSNDNVTFLPLNFMGAQDSTYGLNLFLTPEFPNGTVSSMARGYSFVRVNVNIEGGIFSNVLPINIPA